MLGGNGAIEGDLGAVRLPVGAVLSDSYRVERCIGWGGMGTVYEVCHTRVPRRFAIKVVHGAAEKAPQVMARFRQEAMIGSTLGHDNIVQVFDFNTTPDGSPYFVMELLEGQCLARAIHKEGPFRLERAAAIAHQVLSGLCGAHESGVIHRDLKPENIYLCRRPNGGEIAKILDFGLSKITGTPSSLTQEKALVGTPAYMSPEQAEGRVQDIDERTDLFSFGLVLYAMLAGQVPFSGPNVVAVLYQAVHRMPRPLREIRPDVPQPVEEFVLKAIQKDPAERFQSAREMSQALAAAMGELWKVVLAWSLSPELAGDRVAAPLPDGEWDGAPTIDGPVSPETLDRFGLPPSPVPETLPGLGGQPAHPAAPAMGSADTVPASTDLMAPPEAPPARVTVTGPGEVQVAPAKTGAPRRTVLVAGAVGLAVLVALLTIVLTTRSPEPASKPITAKPPPPAKVSPAAAPAKALPVGHAVTVAIDGRQANCEARIGDRPVERQVTPCRFSVPDRTRLRLAVTLPGARPLERDWVVTEANALKVELRGRRLQLAVAGEALKGGRTARARPPSAASPRPRRSPGANPAAPAEKPTKEVLGEGTVSF